MSFLLSVLLGAFDLKSIAAWSLGLGYFDVKREGCNWVHLLVVCVAAYRVRFEIQAENDDQSYVVGDDSVLGNVVHDV